MYIKKFLEYSKDFDLIEGFQDLGSYGKINKNANCVLVFMAHCIYSQWKFPIAYYLAHSEFILVQMFIKIVLLLFFLSYGSFNIDVYYIGEYVHGSYSVFQFSVF